MENENNNNQENIMNSESQLEQNVFYLEYDKQNINNNMQYKNWERRMKATYGNNIKMLRCLKDKVVFCVTKNKNDEDLDPLTDTCPICQNLICFYCSRYSLYEMFDGNCCLKRGLYYLFFVNACNAYIDKELPNPLLIKIFFIPYVYIPFFIKWCYLFFFEGLPKKTAEDKGNGELESYGKYYHDNKVIAYYIITYIHTLFAFILSIPFILIDFGFHILLLVISIPFFKKFLPLLYYFGIIYGSAHPDFYLEDLIYKIYHIGSQKDYYDLPMK